MTKKREQPEAEPIEQEVVETTEAEPVDELATVYQNAYAQAKSAGAFEGDAKAIAYRSARTWAREHNRRMPDRF